ncbi:MAG: DUF393 domain-containing protein [Planctomycetes bacterium]|nr:DUF393 domain-containing protein [Planctomycetota bacterium]
MRFTPTQPPPQGGGEEGARLSGMAEWDIKMLHDGQCPICSREVAMLRRKDVHHRIAFEDITGPDFDAGRYGLTQAAVEGRMHGVLPDGRIVTGVEVFRRTYRAIGLGWLVAPTGWPVLRWVFDGLYAVFAKVRPWLGRKRRCETDTCRPGR